MNTNALKKFKSSGLLQAWKSTGRGEAEFFAAGKLSLDDTEETHLSALGIDLEAFRAFYERSKALLGPRRFSELTGLLRERQREQEMQGSKFNGTRIQQPSRAASRLVLKHIMDLPPPAPPSLSPSGDAELPLQLQPNGGAAEPAIPLSRSSAEVLEEPPPKLDWSNCAISPRKNKILEEKIQLADTIQTASAIERDRLGFSAGLLVQTLLPHADPGPVQFWEKEIFGRSVVLLPGVRRDPVTRKITLRGCPYGVIPRLTAILISSAVIMNGQKRINFGNSFYKFTSKIGLKSRSEQNHSAAREQITRLLASSIIFPTSSRVDLRGGGVAVVEGMDRPPPIAKNFSLAWIEEEGRKIGGAAALSLRNYPDPFVESHIELTDEFYENVRRHGYPVDLDLVSAIHGSTLSLDIYMFLLHRINLLNKNGYPSTVIQWADLYAMFGSGYKTLRQFAYKAKISIRTIAGFWGTGSKALNYEISPEGLVLKPSYLSAMPASSSEFRLTMD